MEEESLHQNVLRKQKAEVLVMNVCMAQYLQPHHLGASSVKWKVNSILIRSSCNVGLNEKYY